jgi:Flp pilus assembly protein TadB
MTVAILLGALFGAGLVILVTGLIPSRPNLANALQSLHLTRHDFVAAPDHKESLTSKVFGKRLARTALGDRLLAPSRSSLRVIGRTPEEQLARTMTTVITLFFFPQLLSFLLVIAGVGISLKVPIGAGLVLALLGYAIAVLQVRGLADQRRRDFRYALGAFLDVVAISLASGRGIDSALSNAAEIGTDWSFVEIRRALVSARLAGETPWAALARLGTDLDISELNELAASTSLAGDEGARVRQSLLAKSRSMRQKLSSEVQSKAEASTERLALPIVLMMTGFVIFLGYPALARVLQGVG